MPRKRSKKSAEGAPPPIAVLGLCRHATILEGGVLSEFDIRGLSTHVLAPVLPLSLNGWNIVVAVFASALSRPSQIDFLSPSGRELNALRISPPPLPPEPGTPAQEMQRGWVLLVAELEKVGVYEAGVHTFVLRGDNGDVPIGAIFVVVPTVPELSPDRVAAFQAYPGAHDFAESSFGCDECGDRLLAYTGYVRDPARESAGAVWSTELPDRFACSCGTVTIDLTVLRRQMHVLLDPRLPLAGDLSLSRVYEDRAFRQAVDTFSALLESDSDEESIQRFLASHPLFLASFTPTRIIPKAPILNKFVTDFAILDHKRELILVEIERPSTRLVKKDGKTAAPLQHAIDQVNDWIYSIERHRTAALECMGVSPMEVATIRGVVVAGRSDHVNSDPLHRLRSADRGKVTVMTFDDLVIGLNQVLAQYRAEVSRKLGSQ